LLVNPYSPDDLADAIERALSMSREERVERWKPMMENVRSNDVIWWRKRFTNCLENA
jgi:trehalose 6-phosphate synthase